MENPYTNLKPEVLNPIRFRHFRIILQDGKMIKIRKRIRFNSQLQKELIKYNPKDVYMSVSCWLTPNKIKGRKPNGVEWKHLQRVLIRSEFFIDFDSKMFKKNLGRTLKELLKVYNYLKPRYSKFKFVYSGRGYHLWIMDWWEKSCQKKIPQVYDRLDYVSNRKKDLTFELKKKGFKFDEKQSLNVFQIARVPNTLHREGHLVKSFNDFHSLYKHYKQGRVTDYPMKRFGHEGGSLCEKSAILNGGLAVEGTPPPISFKGET